MTIRPAAAAAKPVTLAAAAAARQAHYEKDLCTHNGTSSISIESNGISSNGSSSISSNVTEQRC